MHNRGRSPGDLRFSRRPNRKKWHYLLLADERDQHAGFYMSPVFMKRAYDEVGYGEPLGYVINKEAVALLPRRVALNRIDKAPANFRVKGIA